MDRNLRITPEVSFRPGHWLRAGAMALAVAGLGLALGTAAPATAQEQASGRAMSVPLAAEAPDRYVVKKGDTLWDIAGVFLRDPWYWPEIWYVNPAIANPHLIYPGDVLYLTWVDGKPRVTLERPGSVRLSPQVRSEPLTDAIRAIPYDLLMDFVGRPSLLTKDQVKKRPYVVGIRDRHLIGSDANEIYGRGVENASVDSRYTIVHVGDELRDPDDNDLLGYLGQYAGTARVIDTARPDQGEDGLTHLRVVETGREILQGDLLFPAAVDYGDDFIVSAPKDTKLDGQIIAVVDGVRVAGRYQVVALNRGKEHGLERGNAVAVFERGEIVRDRSRQTDKWRQLSTNYEKVELPKERSATVLLFQVHERMSYGLVVESTSELRVGDFIKHPDHGHRDVGLAGYSR
ncbi:MAG: LysM peptidoglycan-binding domain-containing protein [Steroidobacteraceae bacterium]